MAAACGTATPSPPGLAYALPDPAVLTYESGDTADMDIDAQGQSMQARASSTMTLEVSFTRSEQGIRASADIRELEARQSTPLGTTRADASGIEGPVVFDLDRRGVSTVVSLPEVSGEAVQFVQPLAIAHTMFPRLPGRATDPGDTWTDTVRFEGEQSGGRVSSHSVIEYTVAGDTAVGGRALVRIDFEGTSEVSANGTMSGNDFVQNLSGGASGFFLWDPQRGLLLESRSRGDARGSMEVSAAPFPLTVRVRSKGVVRLREGG